MTLVKFLPNRANCERVILHEYTLFVHNDNHLNTEVHTPITSCEWRINNTFSSSFFQPDQDVILPRSLNLQLLLLMRLTTHHFRRAMEALIQLRQFFLHSLAQVWNNKITVIYKVHFQVHQSHCSSRKTMILVNVRQVNPLLLSNQVTNQMTSRRLHDDNTSFCISDPTIYRVRSVSLNMVIVLDQPLFPVVISRVQTASDNP